MGRISSMFHSALKMGNSGILMYVPHVCKFSTKFTLKFSTYHVKKGHSLYGKGPSKVQINAFWNIITICTVILITNKRKDLVIYLQAKKNLLMYSAFLIILSARKENETCKVHIF